MKPEWWHKLHDQALENASDQWKKSQQIHMQPYIVRDLFNLQLLERKQSNGQVLYRKLTN